MPSITCTFNPIHLIGTQSVRVWGQYKVTNMYLFGIEMCMNISKSSVESDNTENHNP